MVNHGQLPSKTAVWKITEDLVRLVFPGFFHEPTRDSEFELAIARLLNSIQGRLEEEIAKCVRDPAQARRITQQFVDNLPAIRELLMTDVQAARDGDPAAGSLGEIIVAYPCIETITVHRMAHFLCSRGVPILPRIMSEWAHSRTGVDIHPGAQIGSHFFIDHGTGTVIGGTAKIGDHVRLYHGVTLGAKSLSLGAIDKLRAGGQRHPTVKDNVTIYLHATILGGDTVIGARSTINCCTQIMSSIPDDSVVLPNYPETIFSDVSKAVKILDKKAHRKQIGTIPPPELDCFDSWSTLDASSLLTF